jgi:hypothetical protein
MLISYIIINYLILPAFVKPYFPSDYVCFVVQIFWGGNLKVLYEEAMQVHYKLINRRRT